MNFFKVLFIFLPFLIFSQSSVTLKKNAEIMGKAFIAGDYVTFAKYNHPKIIKMMGGEVKMQQTLQQMLVQFKAQGISFLGINFGEAGKITKLKNELVGTIPQTMIMQTAQGKKTKTSKLLAFSYDGGKHWYFSDTSNKDLATIRKLFPEITSEIFDN